VEKTLQKQFSKHATTLKTEPIHTPYSTAAV
jgi:hypothetical protein